MSALHKVPRELKSSLIENSLQLYVPIIRRILSERDPMRPCMTHPNKPQTVKTLARINKLIKRPFVIIVKQIAMRCIYVYRQYQSRP
jgi:hypothetical protein